MTPLSPREVSILLYINQGHGAEEGKKNSTPRIFNQSSEVLVQLLSKSRTNAREGQMQRGKVHRRENNACPDPGTVRKAQTPRQDTPRRDTPRRDTPSEGSLWRWLACENRRYLERRRGTISSSKHQGDEGGEANERRRRRPEEDTPRIHILERAQRRHLGIRPQGDRQAEDNYALRQAGNRVQ